MVMCGRYYIDSDMADEIKKDWFNDRKMGRILHQIPVQLKREAEYKQQSLFL